MVLPTDVPGYHCSGVLVGGLLRAVLAGLCVAGANGCNESKSEEVRIVEAVTGWGFICALLVGGDVHCWGQGVEDFRIYPSDESFVDIDGDATFLCGLSGSGRISCWGSGIESEPVPEGEYVGLSTSAFGACALTRAGTAVCWPDTYLDLPETGSFEWIAAASSGMCGLADGAVSCFCREVGCSISVPPAGTFDSIYAGYDHMCALDKDGHPFCWGGWLYTSLPPEGSEFKILAGGEEYTCGLDRDGQARCWAYFGYEYSDLPSGDDVGQAAAKIMKDGPPQGAFVGIAATYKTAVVWTDNEVMEFGESVSGSLPEAKGRDR